MPQQEVELILMRQLASYLAMPIFLAAKDGNMLYYNQAAAALLGQSFEEAGEMPISELSNVFQITAEDGSPLAPESIPLGIALQERRPAHRRIRFRALDGVERRVEVTAFPLIGQGGRYLGALAVFWETEAS